MFSYILQIIAFQFLFLMVYELLLKKETFFIYNRWYLLSTSILAVILPLIQVESLSLLVPEETFSGLGRILLPEVLIGEPQEFSETLPAVEISAKDSYLNLWQLLYFSGFFGSLFLVFRKFQNLNRLFRFRIITEEKEFKIIEVPASEIACTFFKTIFLGEKLSEEERIQILNHELVHVRQKHSLDLIIFEILKVIFWFNPLIYIYQNKIAAVHEFIADEAVVKRTGKQNYYEQLLNSAFSTRNISFINQFFNHSLIKKRIVMLQKTKSKSISKFKYLVILPLMLVMLIYVACSDDKAVEEINIQTDAADDEALKAALWEEIRAMDAAGVSFGEIFEAFMIEKDVHIKSKEAYYRMQTFARMIHENSIEREKAAGTYKENKENPFQQMLDQDYEEYVAYRKQQDPVQKGIPANIGDEDSSVPFAVINQVPVFPGCEGLMSNEEQKKCMSEKITDYVNKNFNTALGKENNLKGINRIIVQFKIDKAGNIAEVRARAPHPALEEEAIRVIENLPTMEPGKQGGENVGVIYSLPIVFQVAE